MNSGAHVLVVDDEPHLRQLLTDALSDGELHITVAASGKEAIDLARQTPPDLVVTDLRLGDCTGMDVIDCVRTFAADVPAVVITGHDDAGVLAEASQRNVIELLTKPLDLVRLRKAISTELGKRAGNQRFRQRSLRLRRLARKVNIERKDLRYKLQTTCASLASAYRSLSGQMALQQAVIAYQNDLIGAHNDDDVFRSLFRMFAQRSGPVFGVALVCNADAELRVVGRFGVPQPDSLSFCESISRPVIDMILAHPCCMLLDAGEKADLFDESIRRRLCGVSVLATPLLPEAGEMIGLVVLYRKGEQPFVDSDIELAESIAHSTAVAVRRND